VELRKWYFLFKQSNMVRRKEQGDLLFIK